MVMKLCSLPCINIRFYIKKSSTSHENILDIAFLKVVSGCSIGAVVGGCAIEVSFRVRSHGLSMTILECCSRSDKKNDQT